MLMHALFFIYGAETFPICLWEYFGTVRWFTMRILVNGDTSGWLVLHTSHQDLCTQIQHLLTGRGQVLWPVIYAGGQIATFQPQRERIS